MFQVVLIASVPDTGHHCKELGSIFFVLSHQIFVHIDEVTSEPSFLQAEESQLSRPFLIGVMLQSLQQLCYPWLVFPVCLCPSCTGGPRLAHRTQACLTSTEQRRRKLFNLLAILSLVHPRITVAFAARAYCCLMWNLVEVVVS